MSAFTSLVIVEVNN